MPIRFRCQDCSSRVKVPEGTQGKQVKCPRCGRIQSVPSRQDNAANSDLTVHTLVGSMHKAPKRKEALVGTSVDANAETDRYDAYDPSESGASGGGATGGLDIPAEVANEDYESGQGNSTRNPGDSGHHNYRGNHTMSRKKRRRLEAKAARARRDAERARNQQVRIDESRKQVEDIFAGSKYDTRTETAEAPVAETQTDARPEPIALSGSQSLDAQIETVIQQSPMADVPPDYAATQPQPAANTQPAEQPDQVPATGWTLDLTAEAYPFLKMVPWVLRIAALMMIGLAFKAMLIANDQGLSAVACMLVLFAGLALVAVTWTVGEIATAVRDIAIRNATT